MPVGDYVTVAEAAEMLGVTPAAVRKAIQHGLLTPVRVTARMNVITRAELERYGHERRPRGWPAGRQRRRDRQRQQEEK